MVAEPDADATNDCVNGSGAWPYDISGLCAPAISMR
jgi:hypothetical protein